MLVGSCVARGEAEGARAPPHWLVKYAKSHVFGAFKADFWWKIENSPPPKEIGCRSCEVHVVILPEKAFKFPISAEKAVSILVKTFFLTTCFWAVKTLEFPIWAEKSVSISVKTFFFLETICFWAEKKFEFPSFPRNSLSIFGQTVWFWFKNNENSVQGRLHFSHSFKKAPPPPFFQILATRLLVGSGSRSYVLQ